VAPAASATRLPDDTPVELYINGQWRPATGTATLPDYNPASEELLAQIAAGTPDDIDAAVKAARAQLHGEWGGLPGVARGQILNRVADLIERDGEVLATLEALDIGKPIGQPMMLDVPNAAATFRHFAGRPTKSRAAPSRRPVTWAGLRTPIPSANPSASSARSCRGTPH
jgi:betaine-aldehyde dehydrogenase